MKAHSVPGAELSVGFGGKAPSLPMGQGLRGTQTRACLPVKQRWDPKPEGATASVLERPQKVPRGGVSHAEPRGAAHLFRILLIGRSVPSTTVTPCLSHSSRRSGAQAPGFPGRERSEDKVCLQTVAVSCPGTAHLLSAVPSAAPHSNRGVGTRSHAHTPTHAEMVLRFQTVILNHVSAWQVEGE